MSLTPRFFYSWLAGQGFITRYLPPLSPFFSIRNPHLVSLLFLHLCLHLSSPSPSLRRSSRPLSHPGSQISKPTEQSLKVTVEPRLQPVDQPNHPCSNAKLSRHCWSQGPPSLAPSAPASSLNLYSTDWLVGESDCKGNIQADPPLYPSTHSLTLHYSTAQLLYVRVCVCVCF